VPGGSSETYRSDDSATEPSDLASLAYYIENLLKTGLVDFKI
jgi:hypothetical protein